MTTAGYSAYACSSQNPRTHPPRTDVAGRTGSKMQTYLAITAHDRGCEVWCLLRLLDAAKARGFSVIVRAVQSSESSLLPLRVGGLGASAARRANDPRQARQRARTGAGRAAHSASSTLTDPMAKFRRAVERRLAHAPRFLRHYRNRRQIGCTPGVAFRSARERMRQPHP